MAGATFVDRFKEYLDITDPRTLIYSDDAVLKAQTELKNNVGDREFNQKLVNAAVHPVTGEIIPRIFRVSAIAPVNIPLVFAMISCPATNVPGTLFLHWLNQSYNTACNYANRSGADQSTEALMKAYGLAVTSACTLAYGLGKAVERGPRWLKSMGILIPCLATAAANVSNIAFTRMDEITNGVSVVDENEQNYGLSSNAGFECVKQSALTRCVLVPVACLLIPPAGMGVLNKMRLLPASKGGRIVVELSLIFLALQGALPAALAVYPQVPIILSVRSFICPQPYLAFPVNRVPNSPCRSWNPNSTIWWINRDVKSNICLPTRACKFRER